MQLVNFIPNPTNEKNQVHHDEDYRYPLSRYTRELCFCNLRCAIKTSRRHELNQPQLIQQLIVEH